MAPPVDGLREWLSDASDCGGCADEAEVCGGWDFAVLCGGAAAEEVEVDVAELDRESEARFLVLSLRIVRGRSVGGAGRDGGGW